MNFMIFVALFLVCMTFVHPGHTAPMDRELSENDQVRLLSELASLEQPDGIGLPEKRYSHASFTNWKTKNLDSAAMKNLMNYFVGKRVPNKRSDSAASDSDLLPDSSAADLSAYILFLGKIDNSVLSKVMGDGQADEMD